MQDNASLPARPEVEPPHIEPPPIEPELTPGSEAATPEKMLPFVQELARMLREQLAAALPRPVNREALPAAADAANRCFDATWTSIQQLHFVPHACAPACVHCCYLTVEAAAASVFLIAEHLRATHTPLELKRLKAHLRRTVERIRGLTPAERVRADVPCALLKNERCSVYPVRPLGCRSWNSRDVSACAALRAEGSGDLRPAQDQRPFGITAGVSQGLAAALRASTLQGDADAHYELNEALLIALELPDAAQRWLDGADPLLPARSGT